MTEGIGQHQWTGELEASWKLRHDACGGLGPRESIRPDRHPGADARHLATRPISKVEDEAIRVHVPAAPTHRRIVTLDPSDPGGALSSPQEIEMQGLIAKGGMGAVYRARQVSLDRKVAVKRLRPNDAMPDGEALFQSEACITAVLDHPNIVPVYDLGVDQHDRLFYSMKHIHGTPWDKLLRQRDTSSAAAPSGDDHDLRGHLEILLEVANAVAFAHSRGIIHRDLKPQNVIVGEFGEVLVVDWGLAAAIRPLPEYGRIQDLDQVLITCGTPAYMPPEIALGHRQHVGAWTDVYMLGATLFEVLYGTVPHDDKTAVDSVKLASANNWQFPADVPPDRRPFHEVFKPIVMRSLATQPQERFADGQAFADAVKGALRHLDSARLAADAIALFVQAQQQEAGAQQARAQRRDATGFGTVEHRYRMLARAVAGLEQALASWSDNAEARHYLVEAHLLGAHIAIVAGDLTQAESQLQALAALPHGVVADAAQADKIAKLRRRLDDKIANVESRRRRGLALTVAAVVLATAVVITTVVAAVLIGRARDRVVTERNQLARQLIASAADGVQGELHRLFDPVRGALFASRDWAASGRLDSNDARELSAYLIPLINGYPVISSIVRADALGHEYLLLRKDDGWMTRTTIPGEPTRFVTLSSSGATVKEWEEAIDYDPHTRPWYQGGLAVGSTAIHWTEPYTFFTAQEPGITASMAMESPSGRKFVVGVDVPLSDLSRRTMQMSDSELGRVFVLTDDDRVVAVPRTAALLDEAARRAAALAPVDALDDAVVTRAVERWRADGRQNGRRFRLEAEGQPWWGGFRRFGLGQARQLWIGVVLPESDFVIAEEI